MLFFKTKKPILNEKRNESQDNVDLQIINKMNQEFAISLDLKETLNTALQIIITRLNAQAANVFLINNKTKKFMKLKPIANNQTELHLNGNVFFFSYETPVAARVGVKYFKTEQKFSVTTSRHINKWLEDVKCETKPQSFFDEACSYAQIDVKLT